MTNKARVVLTKMMDILVAGLLALIPVAVIGSWWVGAVVFVLGVMWVLRPKETGMVPAWKRMTPEEEKEYHETLDEWVEEEFDCQGYSYDYRNSSRN